MVGSMGVGSHRLRGVVLAAAIAVLLGVLLPGLGSAGGPGKWTKLPSTGKSDGFDEAGVLRTPNGKLHVVWKVNLGLNKNNLRWATISPAGKVLAKGLVLSPSWMTVDVLPQLVPFGAGGVRVVFKGGLDTNPSNFFSAGSVYTATSPDGQHWTLPQVSLAQHTALNGTFAATAELDKTPVSAFGLNNTLWFHEGTDTSAPASVADGTVTQSAFGLTEQALATDKDGSVWMAWYRWSGAATQGVWVERILPTQTAPVKAPGSGLAAQDSNPRQQLAFVERKGGGLFLAYCAPSHTKPCAHIDLWKVGTSKARVVPGSKTGGAGRVTLSAGPKGRLWVAWFDFGKNVIHAVRTTPAGTAFGPVRTAKAPPKTFIFDTLKAEGSLARLDVAANILSTAAGNPIQIWQTQIKP